MDENPEDELIRSITAALRERGAARPGFDARLMSAIRRPRPSALGELLTWVSEPQLVTVSPLGMLAGVATVAALLGATALIAPRVGAPAGVAVPVAPDSQSVRFLYVAPAARSVTLVGSFNGWNPEAMPLRRTDRTGVWMLDVSLPPGRHEYGFLVDGHEWRPDPAAPRGGANEYGAPNSVLLVALRES